MKYGYVRQVNQVLLDKYNNGKKLTFMDYYAFQLTSFGLSLFREHLLFNGVIIKNIKNGNTTEIDHIVINKSGIFVIETKDWKGIIHGDNDSEYFNLVTMNSYENITTNIKNPIKQNMGHVKALQNVLGTNIKYYNCVVFVRGSIRDIDSEYVFTPESLIDYIKEQPNELSIEAVQLLSNTLKDYLLKYPVTHEEHVENLKKRYKDE